jgi:anti-sigma B factor antagonist
MPGHDGLSIRVSDEGPAAVRVLLAGELDLTNREEFDQAVREVESRNPERLLIDLSDLQYVDTSGIACFVQLAQRTHWTPTELRFVRGPRPIERIFEIAGLTEILPFER